MLINAGPFLRVPGSPGCQQDPCDKKYGPVVGATDCHTVAGLLYWYEADAGIVAAENAQFSPWSGQGGSPNATQSVAFARPIYRHRWPGVPSLYFPAYGCNFPNGLGFVLSGTRARASLTAYFVCRYNLSNPASTPFTFTDGILLSTQSTHGGIVFSTRSLRVNTTVPQVHLQASKGAAQTPYRVEAPAVCGWQVLCGVLDSANSLMSLYRNGTLLASAVYAPEAATTDVTWGLFGDDVDAGGGGFEDFEGDCLEVQIYSTAHQAALVGTTSSCLKGRWGLP